MHDVGHTALMGSTFSTFCGPPPLSPSYFMQLRTSDPSGLGLDSRRLPSTSLPIHHCLILLEVT